MWANDWGQCSLDEITCRRIFLGDLESDLKKCTYCIWHACTLLEDIFDSRQKIKSCNIGIVNKWQSLLPKCNFSDQTASENIAKNEKKGQFSFI